MRALVVNVYSRRGRNTDCTNGGISSKYNALLVVCEDGNVEVDEANLPKELCKVVRREFAGQTIFHIEPFSRPDPGCVGWMAGGNFVGSSDSRFSRLVDGQYGAIAIHDRQETQAQYDCLSR